MFWEFGNSLELDDISNYRIFGYIREIYKKNDKKGEIPKFAENRKCLRVIQIWLTIYLHI